MAREGITDFDHGFGEFLHAMQEYWSDPQRQFPEAIDALRRALVLQPDSWSAHAALATVLQQAGATDAAAQEAAEAERRRLAGALEREAAAMTAVGIARLDAEEAIASTTIKDAPIIPVSSTTGAGLDELKRALVAAAGSLRG